MNGGPRCERPYWVTPGGCVISMPRGLIACKKKAHWAARTCWRDGIIGAVSIAGAILAIAATRCHLRTMARRLGHEYFFLEIDGQLNQETE